MMTDTGWQATFDWTCPHCGREWHTEGKRTGFVKAGMFRHVASCAERTPAERRQADKRDAARWAKYPPESRITLGKDHPGLIDA